MSGKQYSQRYRAAWEHDERFKGMEWGLVCLCFPYCISMQAKVNFFCPLRFRYRLLGFSLAYVGFNRVIPLLFHDMRKVGQQILSSFFFFFFF